MSNNEAARECLQVCALSDRRRSQADNRQREGVIFSSRGVNFEHEAILLTLHEYMNLTTLQKHLHSFIHQSCLVIDKEMGITGL